MLEEFPEFNQKATHKNRRKLSQSFNASDIDSNKNYEVLKENEDQLRLKNELFRKLGMNQASVKELIT